MEGYVIIALKSIAVYVFIVAAIRLFGKKEFAQLSVVDLAVFEVDGNISVISENYQKISKRKRKGHKVLGGNTA